MAEKFTELEQLSAEFPRQSRDLEPYVLYVQLGCDDCESQVCFKAIGINSLSDLRPASPNAENTVAIRRILDKAPIRKRVLGSVMAVTPGFFNQDSTPGFENVCQQQCLQEDVIEPVISELNDTFDADLTLDF